MRQVNPNNKEKHKVMPPNIHFHPANPPFSCYHFRYRNEGKNNVSVFYVKVPIKKIGSTIGGRNAASMTTRAV